MRRLFKSRKGSVMDILFLMIGLLVLGMVMLISYKIYDELNTNIQASDVIGAEGKAVSADLDRIYSGTMDNAVLMAVVLTTISIFAFAALVRVHPIFLGVYILALIFLVFLCGVFSNIYQEMAAHPELTAIADNLVFTSHILNYLPLIVGVIGSILAIVMYKLYTAGAG